VSLIVVAQWHVQRQLQSLAFFFDQTINRVPNQPRDRDFLAIRHGLEDSVLFGRQGCGGPRLFPWFRLAHHLASLCSKVMHTLLTRNIQGTKCVIIVSLYNFFITTRDFWRDDGAETAISGRGSCRRDVAEIGTGDAAHLEHTVNILVAAETRIG
jgi:hypothetical protein